MKFLKRLLMKSNKKKPNQEIDTPIQSPVAADISFFEHVAVDGFAVPSDTRTHGYQIDGPTGEYLFRSYLLELGNATLTTGSLDVLYRAGALNLNFFIRKFTKNQAVKMYKNAATDEGTRLRNMIESGNDLEAREAQKALAQAERLLDEITDGYNDGFVGTMVATLFARNVEALDSNGLMVQDHLLAGDHHLRVLYNRQRSGWISSLPIANQKIADRNDRRFLDRTAIVAASPFYSSEIPFSGGVPLGINQNVGSMEFLNVFASYLTNYSSIIVGTSGSGKSFANKYISSSQILLGYRIFSIDPDGENGPICRLMGGREVEVRENSDVCLNICAMTEEEIDITLPNGRRVSKVIVPIGSKTGQILKFYEKLVGDLKSEEKAIIKMAIKNVLSDFQINEDPKSLYKENPEPVVGINGQVTLQKVRKPEFTLMDIYCWILKLTTSGYNLTTLEYEQIIDPFGERLVRVLRGYLRDYPDGRLLDGHTNFGDGESVDNLLDNVSWINFNIKPIESSDIFDTVMHVLTNLGWEYFVKRNSLRRFPKRLKIEEAWRMKRIEGGMAFVEELVRRARKYYAGVDVITQDLTPFMDDPDGRALIKIATSQIFLRLGQVDAEEKLKLKSIFNLSEGELDIICQKPSENEQDDTKGECILRVGGSSAYIKVHVSPEMRNFIDTDPEWLAKNGLLPESSEDEEAAVPEEVLG
ncbi:VirB4 family type IV secretion system protein [Paenibacillus sp. GXUN7292]|uniref:VirB4 family type IV secretion system protein n=1 Tax=Paenibacillus sp. GXUN7292 TaxID=3422499 RepID=UPI003D7CFCF3